MDFLTSLDLPEKIKLDDFFSNKKIVEEFNSILTDESQVDNDFLIDSFMDYILRLDKDLLIKENLLKNSFWKLIRNLHVYKFLQLPLKEKSLMIKLEGNRSLNQSDYENYLDSVKRNMNLIRLYGLESSFDPNPIKFEIKNVLTEMELMKLPKSLKIWEGKTRSNDIFELNKSKGKLLNSHRIIDKLSVGDISSLMFIFIGPAGVGKSSLIKSLMIKRIQNLIEKGQVNSFQRELPVFISLKDLDENSSNNLKYFLHIL